MRDIRTILPRTTECPVWRDVLWCLLVIYLYVVILSSTSMAGERPLSVIYPGKGAGEIRLGNKMKDVMEILGWGSPEEFKKGGENQNEYYLIYKAKGVIFTFLADKAGKELGESILQIVTISSPVFMVSGSGIRVGDKGIDIYNYMQKPPSGIQQSMPLQKSNGECEDKEGDATKKEIVCKGIKFIVNKETDTIEAVDVFYPK